MTEEGVLGSVENEPERQAAVGEADNAEPGVDTTAGDPGNEQHQTSTRKAPPHIPLTPPEDCIPITKDGAVLKKIVQPGQSDEKPSKHARCLVHYVGYLAGNGEVFMDTRQERETEEPVVVVAGRTAAAQETGLCQAAATMCKGERALVYIQDPSYGYGTLGSFSFPCVPPSSQLVYEVEMINWEGVDEMDNDRDRGSLLYEERLERAERRLEAGNKLYKEEKHKEALAKYALALSYIDEDFLYQLEGRYLDNAEAIKLRIHLNMAAAQLQLKDYNTAIYNCGQVLNIDPKNVKALFRRGKARHALGRTEEAQQDLDAAFKLDPKDKQIVIEINAVKETLKRERQATAALFKDRLKPSPAAESAAAATAATAAAAAAAATAAGATANGSAVPAGAAMVSPAAASELNKRTPAQLAREAAAKNAKGAERKASKKPSRGGLQAVLADFFARLLSLVLSLAACLGLRRAVPQKSRSR